MPSDRYYAKKFMKLLTYLILTTSYSSEIDTVIILSLYLVKPRYREVRQLVQYSVSGRDTPLSQAAWLHPCATQLIDNENTKDRRKLGLIFTYSSFLHSKWIWNYYKNDSKSESNKRSIVNSKMYYETYKKKMFDPCSQGANIPLRGKQAYPWENNMH